MPPMIEARITMSFNLTGENKTYLYTLILSQSCMNVKNIIFFFQALGIFTDYMTYLKKINKTICTFLKDLMY